jgi:hypothetical protein
MCIESEKVVVKNCMIISGRFTCWDINVDLQEFVKRSDLSTVCALNIPNIEIIPQSFLDTYKIVHIDRNDVFNLKLFSDVQTKSLMSKTKWDTTFQNAISMFYNHSLLSKYLTNHKYANVLYTRPDIMITNPVDYETLNDLLCQKIPNDSVFIPSRSDWGGINDQMAICNKQTMIAYLNVFENIGKYVTKPNMFHPETLLLYHLKQIGVKIIRFDLKYELHHSRNLKSNRNLKN